VTIPTFAQAVTAADQLIQARYGASQPGLTRAATEAILALINGTTPAEIAANAEARSGWSGIRGDTPAPALVMPRDEFELVKTILERFTEGKDGHWRAHVSAGQITEWREAVTCAGPADDADTPGKNTA
jgi:hypothetical protein